MPVVAWNLVPIPLQFDSTSSGEQSMSTAGVPPLSRAQAEASGPLEARLEALAAAVLRLETRIATLEGAAPARSLPPEALAQVLSRNAVTPPAEGLPGTVSLMGLIGRVCLIL